VSEKWRKENWDADGGQPKTELDPEDLKYILNGLKYRSVRSGMTYILAPNGQLIPIIQIA
jgi:hypothetical protein